MDKEIIDLLEKASGDICEAQMSREKFDSLSLARQKIAHALTLLKQQPKTTSIGNKIREIASKDILGQTKLVRDKDILNQAADRLDAWWKYIGELKEQIKAKDELIFAYESVKSPVNPLISINKDLLEALEKYGRHGVVGGDICEKSKHSDYNCTCGFEVAKAKQ